MARVSFIIAAIAIALVCFAAASEPSTIVTIQNNFPSYNLTVHCDSDIKAHPGVHVVVPKDKYMFSFYPNIEHVWTCTLSTEKTSNLCSKVYNGKFIMWQNHMPFQPTPIWEPMCNSTVCPWFVDVDGLSLIRRPGTKPFQVYDWLSQGNNC